MGHAGSTRESASGLAEDHLVDRAVGGLARDADEPLPVRHRPEAGRRRGPVPAVVRLLFLPRQVPGSRPDVAVSARRGPGLLAARPPARQLRGKLHVPGHRLRPGRHPHAVRMGPARRIPGRGLVLGVRRAAARPGRGRPVRHSARRAFRRRAQCDRLGRDQPGRPPGRPDRGRGGGQGMAGHAAGRAGSWPAAPRSGRGGGGAGYGLRGLRPRHGQLPGPPERPRRRDRIGRRDAVHDLAAGGLGRDAGVPVRLVPAERGARGARAGCGRPGSGPGGRGGDRLAAAHRLRPRPVAAGVRDRRAAGRDLAVPRGQPGAEPAVPALGHRSGRGVPGHRAHHAAPGGAGRAGRGRAHAADLPDRAGASWSPGPTRSPACWPPATCSLSRPPRGPAGGYSRRPQPAANAPLRRHRRVTPVVSVRCRPGRRRGSAAPRAPAGGRCRPGTGPAWRRSS